MQSRHNQPVDVGQFDKHIAAADRAHFRDHRSRRCTSSSARRPSVKIGEMAQTQDNTSRPIRPLMLSLEACKTDNVSLMAQAISLASNPESRDTVQQVMQTSLRRSVARDAPRVLSYLLEQGADGSTITASAIIARDEIVEPSRKVLDVLIAHSWDTDSRGSGIDWPLLWHATSYSDLLSWCLDHGASVYLQGDIPPIRPDGTSSVPRPPVLEIAAANGTVATFEVLRSKGAPLGRRVLHRAVEKAAFYAHKDDAAPTILFQQRMQMVRHLVDTVGLDVNADGRYAGSSCSTLLCYVAVHHYENDARELIWLLLDHGADPDLVVAPAGRSRVLCAMEWAQVSRNTQFLDAVNEWQARH